MRWSWKLARIAGIDVRVHATFLILLAWVGLARYQHAGTALAAVGEVFFIIAVFGSVVLHELGHALTARRFGIRTRDITLLPIGGVAQLEKMPKRPSEELQIAIAGPGVTVAIVAVLYLGLTASGSPSFSPEVVTGTGGSFAARLMWVNVILAGFNLLPAFPMDGGRVLRALLAMRYDHLRATEIAARLGKAFALLFGMAGLLYDPFLVFIALFVWLAAAGETASEQLRSGLGGVPVERVMITDIRTLSPRDTLGTAVDYILAGFQQDFPVIDDGTVIGVLTRANLLKALTQHGRETPVSAAMDRSFQTADPSELLEHAFARLDLRRSRTLPVVRGRELVGVLTTENVGEFLMIESALKKRRI